MAAKPTIITCLSCGTKNRVRPRAQGIPLLIVIKNGQEADRLIGAAPPAQLRAMLERHATAVAEPPAVSG